MHSPRSGRRLGTVSGGLRLLEVLVLLAVGGGVAYFAIDGFKEIIIGPPECERLSREPLSIDQSLCII